MQPEKLPDFTVSRETQEKTPKYQILLNKWQKSINLIAPSTLADAQIRHFEDSLQIAGLVSRETGTFYDLGSGAGFPGLVLAVALPQWSVHLIESDQRKGEFLRTVSRETGTPVLVHTARVENVDIPPPDLITARALASLNQLLEWTEKWWGAKPDLEMIFLKGQTLDTELSEIQNQYDFDFKIYQSKTDPTGRILWLKNVTKRGD